MKSPYDLTLYHEEFVYVRLKSIAWAANETVSPTVFEEYGGDMLAHIIAHNEPTRPLLINCAGMIELVDRALAPAASAQVDTKRHIVFFNTEPISELLHRSLKVFDRYIVGYDHLYVAGHGVSRELSVALIDKVRTLEQNNITSLIRDSFKPFDGSPRRLNSTPLFATGIFNARSLISDPRSFMWLALFLTDEFEMLLENDKPVRPQLLAVSLRGSPFAAAIRMIARSEVAIEIVDHLGPVHQLLEEHSLSKTSTGLDYIYVSDFIIGGTELKIAEAYALRNGCRLTHALTLGTALPPEAKNGVTVSPYSRSVSISALVPDLMQCCPLAKFSFRNTDYTK